MHLPCKWWHRACDTEELPNWDPSDGRTGMRDGCRAAGMISMSSERKVMGRKKRQSRSGQLRSAKKPYMHVADSGTHVA